ncbi:O-antigen ligase [Klenkia marina]|uniref:O-antigen ligase n=1 Tax=Klenkia marina TaxID=1960309 RepID=A0A1G4XH46_9ACTN|nr:hypothetical protein [Klenkia marina]SCX40018.1 O-antigen ligase [Klenkia marina]
MSDTAPLLARPRAAALLPVLLVVVGSVAWRRGDVFSGGVDPVVATKALVSVAALALAFRLDQRSTAGRRVGTGGMWVLAVVLVASVLGALGHGTLVPSAVVAVRVAILAVTVRLLVRALGPAVVLTAVVWSCGIVGGVAAVSGVPSVLAGGRLFGGIPPLNPNEIALLAGVVVIGAAWPTVLGRGTGLQAAVAVTALGVLWLTGSRTSLAVLLLAVAIAATRLRRPQVGLVVGLGLAVAAGALLLASTDAVSSFADRTDASGNSTLDSRLIAWGAALDFASSAWQWAFGAGLSVKLIPVAGQWWNEQLLDSSWVSVVVQAGLVGALVALCWVVSSARGLRRLPPVQWPVAAGLLFFVVLRSVLESGLFDATPALLVLLVVSLAGERGTHERPPPQLGRTLAPGALDRGPVHLRG